jgi:hypothetical protein
VPHEPGHGAIGVDLLVIPPLGCSKRFVLEHTKTEETNATPIAPRPRITYAFPALGAVVPYAGVAYLPPITLFGTRNVLLAAEFGAGAKFANVEVGGRFHATMMKTFADVASAFVDGDPVVLDLFVSSTFGVDAMAGYAIGPVTPYVALGFTDASTLFYVGDDGIMSNNYHPYAGLTFAVGVDGLIAKHFRWGAEFYGAPGGSSLPDPNAAVVPGSDYGSLYTARLRLGVEL